MNVFDLRAGTLYALMALASSVYLLWGFSLRLRSLVKAMMAIQLLGDLFFFPLLLRYQVLRFIKTLSAEDRMYPLLILMGCVIAMDVGAALAAKVGRPRRVAALRTAVSRSVLSNPGQVAVSSRAKSRAEEPLRLNQTCTKQVGVILVLVAILAKFFQLYFVGILDEPSVVYAILTWQPERSLGFTFLENIGTALLPIGLALLVMRTKRKPHWLALFPMLAYGLLSPWKGGIAHLIVIYAFTVQQFGWSELRAMILRRSTLVLAFLVLLTFPIKGQFRNLGWAMFDSDTLVEQFVLGTDARLMGGVFQTFTFVVKNLERGQPYMGGRYNVQVLYLWVPRLLWKDKPRVAGEQIYDYLLLTKQEAGPYGESAFAVTVFGTFYLDFAFWGSLICSFLFGGLLALGEKLLRRLKTAPNDILKVYAVAFTSVWLHAFFPLSESGVPSAFTETLVASAALGMTLLYFLPRKTLWRVSPARAPHARPTW
jgi:oligosaccharide repeat unit polymerase